MPWGPQDVRGRIQIRVFFIATAQAHKLAQCGPVVPVYMSAQTACLAGVRCHHIENENALVPQHLYQLGRSSFQQNPVQPRFLSNIFARLLYRSPGRLGHPLDGQLLHLHRGCLLRNPGTVLVIAVVPAVRFFSAEIGNLLFRLLGPVRRLCASVLLLPVQLSGQLPLLALSVLSRFV